MTARYKPYPEYKPSGVEWLGDVPRHWEACAVWMLFELGRGRVISNEEIHKNIGKYPVYSSQTHDEGVMGSIETFDFDGDYITWTTDGANAGTVFERHGKFNCTNVCGTLKPTTSSSHLTFYRHALDTASAWFVRHDINPKLMNNVVAAIRLPKVPLLEQRAIAEFLDRETGKIDGLIGKQERMIKLLKEKRQAVISRAVTKGLDPNAPMKDSGLEWLGEIPEHWEVKRLKHLISGLESGVSVNAANVSAEAHEIGVLKTSCVSTRIFRIEENKTVVPEEVGRVRCPVRLGAIIISRMNTPALVGAAALVEKQPHNLYLPDRLWQTVYANENNQNPKYLSLFVALPGFRDAIANVAMGTSSSMQNIGQADFLGLPCAFPSKSEQETIVQYLDMETAKIDNLVAKSKQAIELMKERRTALISAAVTGKIDVREAV